FVPSPDGNWIAASFHGGRVALVHLKKPDAKPIFLPLKPNDGYYLAWWPDGSKLAVTDNAGANWVWDVTGAEPKQVATFDGPPVLAGRNSLILSDGKRVLNRFNNVGFCFD